MISSKNLSVNGVRETGIAFANANYQTRYVELYTADVDAAENGTAVDANQQIFDLRSQLSSWNAMFGGM